MKSINRAPPPTATRPSSSLTASRRPGQNAKHQTFNLALTWLLLASAPQSAGAIFRRPSGGRRTINPSTCPGEARRARGKSTAAADILGRQTLSSHLVAFSLLSAKTCVSHLASPPPFASPDPVIAWRRRNQLSPDVVSVSAARWTKDEPGDDARLIAEPRSEARDRKRLSAGPDRFDQTPESRSHVCSAPTCSTSTCV
ncbi:LOW QUALITY PROTEIN: hypothetical protein MKX08_005007 [Trichoderma sp. CBMAI-0020]|nr:LOW QUALITY PROTEIN: hypothetical protein MKX08_005007 [Trichoderma sp. CBMAI-0020]